MKSKNQLLLSLLVTVYFLLFSGVTFGQFNERITTTYFGNQYNFSRAQTITHDQSQNIVFISNAAPNSSFEISKMLPNGTPSVSYKYIPAGNLQLIPTHIINTYDNGFLVVGWYLGVAPTGYPVPPGSFISALFYAKFNNSLSMLTFRVHHTNNSYTLTDVNGVVESDIDGDGQKEYVVNYTTGIANTGFTRLLRLDNSLNPVLEKEYSTSFGASKISYLPTSNLYAIGGIYNSKYSIMLLNGSLNTVAPVRTLNAIADVALPVTTQVIEQKSNPNNIIWAFAGYPSGQMQYQCPGVPDIALKRLNTYIVKMDLGLNLLAEKEYTVPCNYFLAPVAIQNNLTGDGFAVGTNQMYNVVDATGTNVANTKGGLIALDYNLNVQSSYIYNPNDLTYDNNNASYWDDLRYFYPITTGIGNSYILHLSFYGYTGFHPTRIINAYPSGLANCSQFQNVPSVSYLHQLEQPPITSTPKTPGYVTFSPSWQEHTYTFDACQASSKPTSVQAADADGAFRIFPNPASDKVMIEGKLPAHATAVMTDIAGRTVSSNELSKADRNTIDVSGLPPGIYYLSIFSSNEIVKREKLVIR